MVSCHVLSYIDGFPLYDEPPTPSADEYLADPDYPADLSRRSSTNEDGSLFLIKIHPDYTGDLRPKMSKMRYFLEIFLLTPQSPMIKRVCNGAILM